MAAIGNDDTTGDRTLHIRFREGADKEPEETVGALDRGEAVDPHFEVIFHDLTDVHRVTRPKNLN